uniref:AlNc14C5G768 protein n=1 Tax=Albugo laibachii Nc14 TaxID=890382 RepID=F0W0Y8_9STRA|nr:AlNc14C5G768 [Albugo laibachii Nc14]|eukprot:CCA14712.1 AlNc14C5G768 [Albugo laibachii Nc14]
MIYGTEGVMPAAFVLFKRFWILLGIVTFYMVCFFNMYTSPAWFSMSMNEGISVNSSDIHTQNSIAALIDKVRMLSDENAYPIFQHSFLNGHHRDGLALPDSDIEETNEDGEECNLRFSDGAFQDICVISW